MVPRMSGLGRTRRWASDAASPSPASPSSGSPSPGAVSAASPEDELGELISQIGQLETRGDLGKTRGDLGNAHLTPEQGIDGLLRDIELLSGMLGEVIMRESPEIFDLYERFRQHAVARAAGDSDALARMIACAARISPVNCLGVVRAFTQTLNLVNAAEVHHRVRVLRQWDKQSSRVSPLPLIEDSVAVVFSPSNIR
ncbi:hypothetical protein B484DRAFT_389151 [Ochromonadaceae sp. CCMP2298]|nr:hypothetical protein B484DRAFT_389151 [Ochromonadaceae sp. CCMP2298]